MRLLKSENVLDRKRLVGDNDEGRPLTHVEKEKLKDLEEE